MLNNDIDISCRIPIYRTYNFYRLNLSVYHTRNKGLLVVCYLLMLIFQCVYYRSLLYYLDGASLLLHHIPATFPTRLDHIAVGYGHTLALADEGMVYSWGMGSRGQLGHGDRETRKNPVIIESVKGKRIVR